MKNFNAVEGKISPHFAQVEKAVTTSKSPSCRARKLSDFSVDLGVKFAAESKHLEINLMSSRSKYLSN